MCAVAQPAGAHELSLHGLVLATKPATHEAIVRYDASPLHAGGIGTFGVEPASRLRDLSAGQTIDASADIDQKPWLLSHIRKAGSQALTGSAASHDMAAPQILRDVHDVAVGELTPDAAFVDQTGKPFSLSSLHDQLVVVGFVYTRCRDARACPLISAKFHTLQEALRDQPVRLVEVSLDPAYDRPLVLARYARTFGADPERWSMLTGDPERVLDFAAQYDVTAFADERVGIIHPERLVVLDQYGRIRELIDEGSWSPAEIVATLRHDRRLASNPFERFNLWLSSAAVAVCGNSVAGFSGFTDLLTVVGIVLVFAFIFWRLARTIARGAT